MNKTNNMNRIQELFNRKKQHILSLYFTAGFPRPGDTVPLLESLGRYGADMVELGMPYSDPLADGPVIQHSSQLALAQGMTIARLFEQLEGFRARITIPVILMGYMNPVLQYGFERFCADAARLGIDGLILPDLPLQAFDARYGDILRHHGLGFSFLVTPETTEERIRQLDERSSGFLYAVSSSSTTGSDKALDGLEAYLSKLSALPLKNPVMAGFGIRDKASLERVFRHARGGIIGSAFIKALETSTDTDATTRKFLTSLLG